ncbi:MAG: sigma-54 dependent transcriptional regulator [Leptospiraceae bacterium]|nr:sigma-54 dependent transcriptional regulator [Leptospiraceae bacterium]
MRHKNPKVLVIDDDKHYLNFLSKSLSPFLFTNQLELVMSEDPSEAYDLIEKDPNGFSVIITDFQMPNMNGLELIQKIEREDRDYQIILLTGKLDKRITESFLHMNIFDLLEKSAKVQKILESVSQAYAFYLNKLDRKSRIETYLQKFSIGSSKKSEIENSFDRIIGDSLIIKSVLDTIVKISKSEAACLIVGESGTGKELFAKAIFQEAGRINQKFIVIHSIALDKAKLNSILQESLQKRKNSEYSFSTLYFDEVSELSKDLQIELINFLNEVSLKKLPVRILASTNKDLSLLVKNHSFREDLFFRLNVLQLRIPPLRERKEDIKPLLSFYLKLYSELEKKSLKNYNDEFLKKFESYYWPGNVRELSNTIHRIILFTNNDTLKLEDIPFEIQTYNVSPKSFVEPKQDETIPISEMEKRSIVNALNKTNNNKEKAARLLGISRASIYRKMKEYSIE